VGAKVYTDYPGYRLIQLEDANGNVIDTAMVYVPMDSAFVTFNFVLTPGTYGISTDPTVNAQIPGWPNPGPRLKRNNTGVSYPYNVGSLLSITTSDLGSNVYYYFYNWEVASESVACASERVPVEVFYDTDIFVGTPNTSNVRIYPNPATNTIYLQLPAGENRIAVYDATGRRVVKRNAVGGNDAIDVTGLAAGVYSVNVITANGLVTTNVVVTK
jgi:hypothetical protein